MIDTGHRGYWPAEWPDWPQDPTARKAVAGSLELGLIIMNAPASLRKLRLKEADEKGQIYLVQMTEEEQEKAKDLAARWESNALTEQRIRYFEMSEGIEAARPLNAEWESAEFQMNKIEEEATQLGLAGNEYFRTRVEQFRALEAEKDEFGQFHNLPDHSELREQWYSHEPITAPLPWPWENMLVLCKRLETRGKEDKERSVKRRFATLGIVLTIVFGVAGIIATVITSRF